MDTKIIGGKIAKARKAINMSQARLAQQLFISPQAVGKWERGSCTFNGADFNRCDCGGFVSRVNCIEPTSVKAFLSKNP